MLQQYPNMDTASTVSIFLKVSCLNRVHVSRRSEFGQGLCTGPLLSRVFVLLKSLSRGCVLSRSRPQSQPVMGPSLSTLYISTESLS